MVEWLHPLIKPKQMLGLFKVTNRMAAVAALHGSYKHNSQSSVLGPFFPFTAASELSDFGFRLISLPPSHYQ